MTGGALPGHRLVAVIDDDADDDDGDDDVVLVAHAVVVNSLPPHRGWRCLGNS